MHHGSIRAYSHSHWTQLARHLGQHIRIMLHIYHLVESHGRHWSSSCTIHRIHWVHLVWWKAPHTLHTVLHDHTWLLQTPHSTVRIHTMRILTIIVAWIESHSLHLHLISWPICHGMLHRTTGRYIVHFIWIMHTSHGHIHKTTWSTYGLMSKTRLKTSVWLAYSLRAGIHTSHPCILLLITFVHLIIT